MGRALLEGHMPAASGIQFHHMMRQLIDAVIEPTAWFGFDVDAVLFWLVAARIKKTWQTFRLLFSQIHKLKELSQLP